MMAAGQSGITVDTRNLERRLSSLRKTEIPSAIRNTINDLMEDVVKRERQEIKTVFDRPTPYIANSPAIKTKATKLSLKGEVWLRGERNVLKPHIPGYAPRRDLKKIENVLRRKGLLSDSQYLMPSNTMRLDQYGNVSKRTIDAMAAELSGSKEGIRYIWGSVKGRNVMVSGIWHAAAFKARKPGALALLAVNKEPTYGKVFDFFGVAQRRAKQRVLYHADRAIDQAIRRRNR